jgi:hypothetical protein
MCVRQYLIDHAMPPLLANGKHRVLLSRSGRLLWRQFEATYIKCNQVH